MPLTDVAVRKAIPVEKAYRLSDEKGMYLEVSPTGAGYWRLKYRLLGIEKPLALGVYPEVTLKDARAKRDAARKLLAEGTDPSAQKKAAKVIAVANSTNGFEATAREWFGKHKASWVAGHSDKIMRRLERDVFPWLGKQFISSITAP